MAFASGVFSWTLLEYLVHRFLNHKIKSIKIQHLLHHNMPKRLFGVPFSVSLLISLCFYLIALNFTKYAFIVSLGLYCGYYIYIGFHHAMHYHVKTISKIPYFKHMHFFHAFHHKNPKVNYGVTTTFWDYLFNTKA